MEDTIYSIQRPGGAKLSMSTREKAFHWAKKLAVLLPGTIYIVNANNKEIARFLVESNG